MKRQQESLSRLPCCLFCTARRLDVQPVQKACAPIAHGIQHGNDAGAVSHQQTRLEQVWVSLLDKFRTTQDARDDYKGSQMHLANDSCVGAHRPDMF